MVCYRVEFSLDETNAERFTYDEYVAVRAENVLEILINIINADILFADYCIYVTPVVYSDDLEFRCEELTQVFLPADMQCLLNAMIDGYFH